MKKFGPYDKTRTQRFIPKICRTIDLTNWAYYADTTENLDLHESNTKNKLKHLSTIVIKEKLDTSLVLSKEETEKF
jgi:hypothetical protein